MLNSVLHMTCSRMFSEMYVRGLRFDLCYADHVFDAHTQMDLRWLDELRSVAKPNATLYVHTDQRAVFSIIGAAKTYGWKQRSWIIWSYDWGGRPRNLWAPKHDDIIMFTIGDEWTFNAENVAIPKKTLINSKKNWKIPTDVWSDIPILHTMSKEKDKGEHLEWQKPEQLLNRIIKASSNSGDLVIDPFCGTGTTGVECKKLGRSFIMCDIEQQCVDISNRRLANV